MIQGASGPLYMYRIEVDGHFHGGPPVKPWAARITGPSPRFGLEREFVRPLNDWAEAHAAHSGNVYGVVATFPLRSGAIYEISRTRGNSSKRYVHRGFYRVDGSKLRAMEPVDVLAAVDGGESSAVLRVKEREPYPTVVDVLRASPLGFVLVDGTRLYRLRAGLYRVEECDGARLVLSDGQTARVVTREEGAAWVATH